MATSTGNVVRSNVEPRPLHEGSEPKSTTSETLPHRFAMNIAHLTLLLLRTSRSYPTCIRKPARDAVQTRDSIGSTKGRYISHFALLRHLHLRTFSRRAAIASTPTEETPLLQKEHVFQRPCLGGLGVDRTFSFWRSVARSGFRSPMPRIYLTLTNRSRGLGWDRLVWF